MGLVAKAALFLVDLLWGLLLLLVLVPGLASGVLAATVWSLHSPAMVTVALLVAVARLLAAPSPRGWVR
ncbi:hypothetical protein [Streptomyces reniochalinae]|nr:hypothetical protein [Streptomyces reniochalinae]